MRASKMYVSVLKVCVQLMFSFSKHLSNRSSIPEIRRKVPARSPCSPLKRSRRGFIMNSRLVLKESQGLVLSKPWETARCAGLPWNNCCHGNGQRSKSIVAAGRTCLTCAYLHISLGKAFRRSSISLTRLLCQSTNASTVSTYCRGSNASLT